MGALEDAIQKGDFEEAARLSPFFAQARLPQEEDIEFNPGGPGGIGVRDPTLRANLARILGRAEVEDRRRIGNFNTLMQATQISKNIRDPRVQAAFLSRFIPGLPKPQDPIEQEFLKAEAIERAKAKYRQQTDIEPGIIDAAGTDRFGDLFGKASKKLSDRDRTALLNLHREGLKIRERLNRPERPQLSTSGKQLTELETLGFDPTRQLAARIFGIEGAVPFGQGEKRIDTSKLRQRKEQKFESADDVLAAVNADKLDPEQARQILIEQFGFRSKER